MRGQDFMNGQARVEESVSSTIAGSAQPSRQAARHRMSFPLAYYCFSFYSMYHLGLNKEIAVEGRHLRLNRLNAVEGRPDQQTLVTQCKIDEEFRKK